MSQIEHYQKKLLYDDFNTIAKRFKSCAERIAYNIELVNKKGALSNEYINYKLATRAHGDPENNKKGISVIDLHLHFDLQYFKKNVEDKIEKQQKIEVLKKYIKKLLVGETARREIYIRSKIMQNKSKK